MGRVSPRGAATAELAVALPLVVLVTVGMVWFVSVGVAQIRLLDAAREAARVSARGESTALAYELASRIGPAGTKVEISEGEETVRATARVVVRGPGGLFRFAAINLHAEAVSAREPD